jgi:crossover junction endodeoxyribonuclease RuvC
MRVIGIDPGSRLTGYGVVERAGNKLIHIHSGTVKTVDDAPTFGDRLVIIFETLRDVIAEHKPQTAALETLFHAKNVQSAIKLSHARGVAVLAVKMAGLPMGEYAPTLVKQAVVGHGHAEKEQVQKMVSLLLGVPIKGPFDTSDALAVAICHLHHHSLMARVKSM